ncbi:hypothetical protein H2200_000824 [Cladophialophora chaetospira]|uniref:NmrA-like domain-containing protein n=1 Tax=Cladophialophora chaetospira TaxID=386627 RepID=A0AA38XP76_9EURO|nr:hypothetical protein H2200_000824 [Cladophialophora chaetospira]
MARVGLLGASGETGSSILEALVEDAGFEIIALVRPASLSKPANVVLKDRGIELRALDLEGSQDSMAAALEGLDILISAIGPRDQLAQIPLVPAVKKAGVKRFVPCGFAPVMPVGVHRSRDQKEEVYNLVKRLHIPYTIIDIGWWYQFSLPKLPSCRIDYAVGPASQSIAGDGNAPSAMTDLRDVGKYVTRVIKDERTLNAMVFVYNELWTSNQVYDLLEKLSGEKIPRKYTSAKDYERQIAEADVTLKVKPEDFVARAQKVLAQYALSVGIRGENTPEFARYLGYLDGKKLYPDVKFFSFESYVQEVLGGKAKGVYEDLMPLMKNAIETDR